MTHRSPSRRSFCLMLSSIVSIFTLATHSSGQAVQRKRSEIEYVLVNGWVLTNRDLEDGDLSNVLRFH